MPEISWPTAKLPLLALTPVTTGDSAASVPFPVAALRVPVPVALVPVNWLTYVPALVNLSMTWWPLSVTYTSSLEGSSPLVELSTATYSGEERIPVGGPGTVELREVRSGRTEPLDTVVALVGDVDVGRGVVDRHPGGFFELPQPRALPPSRTVPRRRHRERTSRRPSRNGRKASRAHRHCADERGGPRTGTEGVEDVHERALRLVVALVAFLPFVFLCFFAAFLTALVLGQPVTVMGVDWWISSPFWATNSVGIFNGSGRSLVVFFTTLLVFPLTFSVTVFFVVTACVGLQRFLFVPSAENFPRGTSIQTS